MAVMKWRTSNGTRWRGMDGDRLDWTAREERPDQEQGPWIG